MSKSIGCEFTTCQAALNDYLNKVAIVQKPRVPAGLVSYEVIGDETPVRLSFQIKVF